jgi:hypothetical protein
VREREKEGHLMLLIEEKEKREKKWAEEFSVVRE